MDASAVNGGCEGRGHVLLVAPHFNAGSGGRFAGTGKGLNMLMWIVIVATIVALVLLAKGIDRSRGSHGASRSLDLPGTKEGRPRHIDTNDGFNGM